MIVFNYISFNLNYILCFFYVGVIGINKLTWLRLIFLGHVNLYPNGTS